MIRLSTLVFLFCIGCVFGEGRKCLEGSDSGMPFFPSPTPVAEMSDKEFAARIPNEISWVEFPLADRVVENVPQYIDSARYMRGRIERYQSGRDQLELTFRIGLSAEGNWGEVKFNGPLVTLRMSRGVSVPAEEVVGREISLQFNEEGDLLAMNFLGIAVTHARVPLKGEKREVRALLETDDLFALFDENASEAVRRKAIDDATSFYFRPDKMALVDQDTTELMFFRVLQLMKEYGVVVQTMDTGPGMLELERLALPEPAENPWIPVADWSTWGPTPPAQRAMKRE